MGLKCTLNTEVKYTATVLLRPLMQVLNAFTSNLYNLYPRDKITMVIKPSRISLPCSATANPIVVNIRVERTSLLQTQINNLFNVFIMADRLVDL